MGKFIKRKINDTKTRKDIRKEKRQLKKVNRKEYYNRKSNKKSTVIENCNMEENINEKTLEEKVDNEIKKEAKKDKLKMKKDKVENSIKKQRSEQLLQANIKEDKLIKSLEKQLKLNKRKSKTLPKSFALDGLDYLLEVCDKGNVEDSMEYNNFNDCSLSDTDDELTISQKKHNKINKNDNENNSNDANLNTSQKVKSQKDDFFKKNKDIHSNSMDHSDYDSDGDFSDNKISEHSENDNDVFDDNDEFEMSDENQEENLKEDIYGRKRDAEGNVITEKYVPRFKLDNTDDTEESLLIKRKVKGLLNKLTDKNIHWVSTQLEMLYLSHSRNSVNSAFCSLWMDAILKNVTAFDRMAIEHASLVAIMQANVGSEIGAHFLQSMVMKFESLVKSQENKSKELDNIILGLSHLYNFKIFSSSLLYEILDKLVENLSEKNIECILIILRSVGNTLRKDDPISLKSFICNTQKKVKQMENVEYRSRINFLIEILLAIKNNNMNKIPNYDTTYSEEMKKNIKPCIRRGNSVTSLNISLKDLLNADKQGKWWIVGSAWEGGIDKMASKDNTSIKKNENTEYLLKLADSQQINTELRRNIFCIIMSADDYIDAFEKLQHLNLSSHQEKEIVNVILSCCLQEKVSNPYYSFLSQKFCDYNRKFQIHIQYCVWDKLKDLSKCEAFQIKNLAEYLKYLFIVKSLPISVLKIIEFSSLNKKSMKLMRHILIGVLLHENLEACLAIFQRISVSPKLHMFRESLRLFCSHFILKNIKNKDYNEDQLRLLNYRCQAIDKILNVNVKLRF